MHNAIAPCPACPACRTARQGGPACPWQARAVARHQAMRQPRPRPADLAARALVAAALVGPALGAALVPYQAMALAWWQVHPAPPALAPLLALVGV